MNIPTIGPKSFICGFCAFTCGSWSELTNHTHDEHIHLDHIDKPNTGFLGNIRQTYSKGLAIIEKKNKDYGATDDHFKNFRSASILGLSVEKAILVRTLDKLARINNLLEHEAYVTEETLEDTLIDAINYLAILKAYREMGK